MPTARTPEKMRSDDLLQTLSDFERIVIVTHDNPDPDAIATGWAVHTFVGRKLNKPVALLGGGAIVRAENRHMVDLLSPPIELVDELVVVDGEAVVLVDCGINMTNHLVTRHGIHPVAVIDHHLDDKRSSHVPFVDARPDVVAATSIAASYLREQGVEPGEKLATAMLYAIRTETRGFETHHSELDRTVVLWLTERADQALLAEIECAPLSRDYFDDLALALYSSIVFEDAAFCLLPRAEGAEIVGEVADMLVRCRSICRVFCGALIGSDLVVSVRTKRSDDNAAQLVQRVLDGLGSGGGHGHRAGGKIPDWAAATISDEAVTDLRRRWLTACGIADSKGAPLISLTEILGHPSRKKEEEARTD